MRRSLQEPAGSFVNAPTSKVRPKPGFRFRSCSLSRFDDHRYVERLINLDFHYVRATRCMAGLAGCSNREQQGEFSNDTSQATVG